jgi:hypothetical protein
VCYIKVGIEVVKYKQRALVEALWFGLWIHLEGTKFGQVLNLFVLFIVNKQSKSLEKIIIKSYF